MSEKKMGQAGLLMAAVSRPRVRDGEARIFGGVFRQLGLLKRYHDGFSERWNVSG